MIKINKIILIVLAIVSIMTLGCINEPTTETVLNLGENHVFKKGDAEYTFQVNKVMFSTKYESKSESMGTGSQTYESRPGYQFMWVYLKVENVGTEVIEFPKILDIHVEDDKREYFDYYALYPNRHHFMDDQNINVMPKGDRTLRPQERIEGWRFGVEVPENFENLKIVVAPSASEYYTSFEGQSAIWIVKKIGKDDKSQVS